MTENQPQDLSEALEGRIAKVVAASLATSPRFAWKVVWRSALTIMAILSVIFGWGFWSIIQNLRTINQTIGQEVSNAVQKAQNDMRATIAKKFEASEVQTILESVAANEAKDAMLRSIKPQVERFEQDLNTMANNFSNSVPMIPDGRVVLGGSVMGRPWILEKEMDSLKALLTSGQTKEAYRMAT